MEKEYDQVMKSMKVFTVIFSVSFVLMFCLWIFSFGNALLTKQWLLFWINMIMTFIFLFFAIFFGITIDEVKKIKKKCIILDSQNSFSVSKETAIEVSGMIMGIGKPINKEELERELEEDFFPKDVFFWWHKLINEEPY